MLSAAVFLLHLQEGASSLASCIAASWQFGGFPSFVEFPECIEWLYVILNQLCGIAIIWDASASFFLGSVVAAGKRVKKRWESMWIRITFFVDCLLS